MRHLILTSTLFALVSLAFACGSDDEPPMSRNDFCVSWAKRACSEESVSACQAPNVEACQDSQLEACLDLVPNNFIDDHADECLRAVESAYRDGDLTANELKIVLDLGAPCNQLVRGEGETDDGCDADQDCDASQDLECVKGTCQVREEVGAGFECDQPQQVCEEGFFCNGDNCIATQDEDEDCASTDECDSTLFCNADEVCEARGEVRDPCGADEQCVSGLCLDFDGQSECVDRIRLARSEPLCDTLR
jgi:hypothetical protein